MKENKIKFRGKLVTFVKDSTSQIKNQCKLLFLHNMEKNYWSFDHVTGAHCIIGNFQRLNPNSLIEVKNMLLMYCILFFIIFWWRRCRLFSSLQLCFFIDWFYFVSYKKFQFQAELLIDANTTLKQRQCYKYTCTAFL